VKRGLFLDFDKREGGERSGRGKGGGSQKEKTSILISSKKGRDAHSP